MFSPPRMWWAKPPSESEEAKGERVARMVRDALRSEATLKDCNFDIVVVGSYRNNTNVRNASDVDLAAVLRSATYPGLPDDGSITRESLGLGNVSYGLQEFRTDVSRALRYRFGSDEIEPGKLTLTIDETSARLGADVTPYLIHRRYRKAPDGGVRTYDGIETRPSNEPNRRVIQWPEQHYAAGVTKNTETNHRYKRVVRILKRLRDELADAHKAGGDTASCFLEHVVFNAPNTNFNTQEGSYYEDVQAVLAFLWERRPGRPCEKIRRGERNGVAL